MCAKVGVPRDDHYCILAGRADAGDDATRMSPHALVAFHRLLPDEIFVMRRLRAPPSLAARAAALLARRRIATYAGLFPLCF